MGRSTSKSWSPIYPMYSALYSLPDEVLLKVFSFLQMDERCNVARVCCRFNALIRDRSLWHTIDVVQVIEKHFERKLANPILLLYDQCHPLQMKYSLLWFLNAYAKDAKRLCLTTASRSVLSYVHDHCRNVQQLHLREYSPSTRRLPSALKHLPNNIVTLKIEFPSKFNVTLCDKETHSFLANPLYTLKELTLQGVAVNIALCEQLAQLTQLRHLRFMWCTISKHLSLQNCEFLTVTESLEICCCLFVSFSKLGTFLIEIARYGNNLVTFHFQMPNSETNLLKVDLSRIKSRYRHMLCVSSIDIDAFLCELCLTPAMRIRHLYFRGNFTLSRHALAELTHHFDGLEGLSLGDNLQGCMLLTIAKNLRNLKVMDLCKGRFSDSWLHCFQYHQSLMALRVYQSRRLSCHELCEIVATLPKMQLICTTQHEQLQNLQNIKSHMLITNKYCEWVNLIDKYVHRASRSQLDIQGSPK